jgi:hypothetical protein
MKTFQTFEDMVCSFPNNLLIDSILTKIIKSFIDDTLKISSIGIFHDNTQGLYVWHVEAGLVCNDIWHADRSQEPNFIERSTFLFLFGVGQKH